MAHSRSIDITDPANTARAGLGAQEIRENKEDVQERMLVDHNWGTGESATDGAALYDGYHKKVTLATATSVSAGITDAGIVHVKDAVSGTATTADLHYMNEGSTDIQLTSGNSMGATDTSAKFDAIAASGAITSGSTVTATGVGTFYGGLTTGSTALKTVVINIGDWNMDSTQGVVVAHSLGADFIKIRKISVMIIDDSGTYVKPLVTSENASALGTPAGGTVRYARSSDIILDRLNGGAFDSADYDSTSYNRGWITLDYEA